MNHLLLYDSEANVRVVFGICADVEDSGSEYILSAHNLISICYATMQPYELMNLADALERKYYQDGQCIIKQVCIITYHCPYFTLFHFPASLLYQDDEADAFYIVESGTAKITREDPVSCL